MAKKRVIADFRQFWAAYPKHAKPPAARGAWKRLAPDKKLLEKMLIAIEIQKKPGGILAIQPDVGDKYIPHAVSWLTNERWLELPDDQPELVYEPVEFTPEEVADMGLWPTACTKGDYGCHRP